MKKTLVVALLFLAAMTMGCKNKGNGGKDAAKETETLIRQRVEQMIAKSAEQEYFLNLLGVADAWGGTLESVGI